MPVLIFNNSTPFPNSTAYLAFFGVCSRYIKNYSIALDQSIFHKIYFVSYINFWSEFKCPKPISSFLLSVSGILASFLRSFMILSILLILFCIFTGSNSQTSLITALYKAAISLFLFIPILTPQFLYNDFEFSESVNHPDVDGSRKKHPEG